MSVLVSTKILCSACFVSVTSKLQQAAAAAALKFKFDFDTNSNDSNSKFKNPKSNQYQNFILEAVLLRTFNPNPN